MKILFTAGLTLLFVIATCEADGLIYDIQMSEVIDGNKVKTEEKEVFIEESYVTPEPPVIYMSDEDVKAFDDQQESNGFVGRESYNITELELESAFEKSQHEEEHMNFQSAFGLDTVSTVNWTPWTCCRRVVEIRTRQRIRSSPQIELEYHPCTKNFCHASQCRDAAFLCQQFTQKFGLAICEPTNSMATFMSHNCPKMCNYCSSGPASTRPTGPAPTRPWWQRTTTTTTRRPWFTTTQAPKTQRPVNRNVVEVTVLTNDLRPPSPSYKFVKDTVLPSASWRRIPRGGAELSSFYLYSRPTGAFTTAIRFCYAKDRITGLRKYVVKKGACGNAWVLDFTLYASTYRTKGSQVYYVGNRGAPYWTSRVSKSFPSKGYTKSLFYFYGPKSTGSQPTRPISRPTPRPSLTRRPSPRPFITRPERTTRRPAPVTTARPTRPGVQPTSAFNKECLDAHNLFRAVHNVPLLKWDPQLERTSQAWATALARIAPERPDQLKSPGERTRNWPHSDSGKGYRNRGDGENIAWDLSDDGSPAKESVMRWYAELFYYNRQTPTRAPAADKPVGHLTQLLWKDTTHVGCGVGTTRIPRQHYTLISTWTVSHYSPGGNIRYPSAQMTNQLYNKQVPDMRQGSCLTNSGTCRMGNQCMAFGGPNGQRSTCSCFASRPTCRGNHGCLAWCENKTNSWPWKSECQGTTECRCTAKGAVCK